MAAGGSSLVDYNLDNNVVTLGWGDRAVDAPVSTFWDKERLKQEVVQWCERNWQPEWKESDKTTAPSSIWKFCHDISIGDIVVLPPKGKKWIAIGMVTGHAMRDVGRPEGARLYREVMWLNKKVPLVDVPDIHLQKSIKYARKTLSKPKARDAFDKLSLLVDFGIVPRDESGILSDAGLEVREGAKTRIEANRYVRRYAAKMWRLDYDDYTCQVCDLKFEDRYGEFAEGYMHVHHILPLSQVEDPDNHKINPKNDLVAVCPNCHAMLHRHEDNPCSVEKLRELMAETQR